MSSFFNLYSKIAKSFYSLGSYNVTTMRKPIKLEMEGFEVVEKIAVKGGNSSRIYVPKKWEGKKVRAVLIE